jgi:hypothetical protein
VLVLFRRSPPAFGPLVLGRGFAWFASEAVQRRQLTGRKPEETYRRRAITDAAVLPEGVEKLARLNGASPDTGKVVPIREANG